jgi:uncharacterized protein YbjT (DUF2867 family)
MAHVLITGGTGVLGQSLLARSAAHEYDVRLANDGLTWAEWLERKYGRAIPPPQAARS